MSVSAREMVEFHRDAGKLYTEADRRYPDATCERMHGYDVVVTDKPVDHDRILIDGDMLVACGTIERDEGRLPVLSSRLGGRPMILAIDYLKKEHPEAYAGLIQWLVKG